MSLMAALIINLRCLGLWGSGFQAEMPVVGRARSAEAAVAAGGAIGRCMPQIYGGLLAG